MVAERDISLARETVQDLYARGEEERARALEAVLAAAPAAAEREPSPRSEYMTTGQAARALGVSLQTVKNWVAAGHLTAVRLGGRLLVPRAAIHGYLDELRSGQQRRPAASAANAKAAREQHVAQIDCAKAEQQALRPRQVAEVSAPVRAVDDEPQIYAERRCPEHPERRAGDDERQRGELRAARVHDDRHQDGERQRQAALDHRDSGDESPGRNAERRRDHLAETAAELRMADAAQGGAGCAGAAAGSSR